MKNINTNQRKKLFLLSLILFFFCYSFIFIQSGNIPEHFCHKKDCSKISSSLSYYFEVESFKVDAESSSNSSNSGNWTWVAENFEWCSGNGSFSDPFTIENVSFHGEGSFCLSIQNSNLINFVIRNCTFSSEFDETAGINLWRSSGGFITANNVSNNYHGILLIGSENTTLTDNIASNCQYGIKLQGSENNFLLNNTASNNLVGINIDNSDNNILKGNNISENGFGIQISYSVNNTVTDNFIFDHSMGIRLLNSDYNRVIGNNASGSGISLHKSSNNFLSDNIASRYNGIYLGESNYNTLINNSIFDNRFSGVHLDDSDYNILENNTMYNNGGGCIIDEGVGNVLVNNLCQIGPRDMELIYSDILTFLLVLSGIGIILIYIRRFLHTHPDISEEIVRSKKGN